MPYSRSGITTPAVPEQIQDEGVDLARRGTINFVGNGVSVTDSGGKTVVTIEGIPRLNWAPFEAVAETMTRGLATGTASGISSGTPAWFGGCIIPAGATVDAITFISNAATVSPTNQFFAIAIPDDAADNAIVLGVTEDDLTTAWGSNTTKQLSLAVADGGSGVVTFTQDTPVYLGIIVVAATPPTLRGLAASAFVHSIASPLFCGGSAGGVTTPGTLNSTVGLNNFNGFAYAYAKGSYL